MQRVHQQRVLYQSCRPEPFCATAEGLWHPQGEPPEQQPFLNGDRFPVSKSHCVGTVRLSTSEGGKLSVRGWISISKDGEEETKQLDTQFGWRHYPRNMGHHCPCLCLAANLCCICCCSSCSKGGLSGQGPAPGLASIHLLRRCGAAGAGRKLPH